MVTDSLELAFGFMVSTMNDSTENQQDSVFDFRLSENTGS